MTGTLHLFARIEPKAEHFEAVRKAILDIIPATFKEPGCQAFVLHEGRADGRLYLYEEFTDDASLKAHNAMPYTRAILRQVRRMACGAAASHPNDAPVLTSRPFIV